MYQKREEKRELKGGRKYLSKLQAACLLQFKLKLPRKITKNNIRGVHLEKRIIFWSFTFGKMEPLRILAASLLLILNCGLSSASMSALSAPKASSSDHQALKQEDAILSRRRRFLKPKAGSRLTFFISLIVPIEDAVWPFTMDYPYIVRLDDIT